MELCRRCKEAFPDDTLDFDEFCPDCAILEEEEEEEEEYREYEEEKEEES